MITPAQIEAAAKALQGLIVKNYWLKKADPWGVETLAEAALTAAARVGGRLTDDELMDAEADMLNRTIERCAQVAEEYIGIGAERDNIMARTIAAAIRKLKEEL